MTNRIIYIYYIPLMLALFASCKDNQNNNPLTDADLTSYTWVLNNSYFDPPITLFDIPVQSFIEDCDKDNELRFKTDGKLSYSQGLEKCPSEVPFPASAEWALIEGVSQISISDDSGTVIFAIEEVTTKILVISIKIIDIPQASSIIGAENQDIQIDESTRCVLKFTAKKAG